MSRTLQRGLPYPSCVCGIKLDKLSLHGNHTLLGWSEVLTSLSQEATTMTITNKTNRSGVDTISGEKVRQRVNVTFPNLKSKKHLRCVPNEVLEYETWTA